MSGTIFDLVQGDIPEGKEGYFEIAKRAPTPKDNSFFNDIKDYGKTILKGGVEGISKLGRIMSPLIDESPDVLEKQTEALDELLPTKDSFKERSLRRGLKEAPSVMASPFGGGLQALPRAISAGFLGEGGKELGLPEWAQTALELTAYMGPDVTKKLIEKGSNKDLIKAAKELGISDETLAPLLNSDFKQKWLSKLAPKRGSAEAVLKQSKGELSKAYSTISNSKDALKVLPKEAQDKLLRSFSKQLMNMPSAVRNKIKEDFRDLLNSKATGQDLINFFGDINHNLGDNAKQLSLLKEPIREALATLSPKLGEDFRLINDLHSKFYKIESKLKPTLRSDITEGILGASEALGALFGLVTGNVPLLFKIAGEKVGRNLSKQLLLNPRFQQISSKIVDAANQNKFGIVGKLVHALSHEVKKTSPEFSQKLENISDKELKELLNPSEK